MGVRRGRENWVKCTGGKIQISKEVKKKKKSGLWEVKRAMGHGGMGEGEGHAAALISIVPRAH